jgi:hypothetical protein
MNLGSLHDGRIYDVPYDEDRDRIKARMYAEKHLALRRELGDLDGIMSANLLLAYHHLEVGEEADISRARMLIEEAQRYPKSFETHGDVFDFGMLSRAFCSVKAASWM